MKTVAGLVTLLLMLGVLLSIVPSCGALIFGAVENDWKIALIGLIPVVLWIIAAIIDTASHS